MKYWYAIVTLTVALVASIIVFGPQLYSLILGLVVGGVSVLVLFVISYFDKNDPSR